jgi:translation initiation factor IF-2
LQQTKDNKEKVRVFALARQLGVDSKTVIDLCRSLGYDVKSQLASLEADQVDVLKQRIARGAKPVVEPARPAPASIPPKDKKIVNLVGKPKVDVRSEPEYAMKAGEVAEGSVSTPATELELPSIAAAMPLPASPEVVNETIAPNVGAETLPPQTPVAAATTERFVASPPMPPTSPESPAASLTASPGPDAPPGPVTPPPRLPTPTTTRMHNLSGTRPPSPDRTRPPVIPPPKQAGPAAVAVPPAKSTVPPTSIPPRSGVPTAVPRIGPGPSGPLRPGQTGGPGGTGPGQRHRRSEADRKPGAVSPPAARGPGLADKKTPPALRFTPEQLKDLREGRSVTDILKKPAPGAPGLLPGKGDEGDEVDEEGKKKVPGKVVGRDSRHADRAKRQEQRKVRQSSVVIQDGHVDLTEESFGTKRGKRPKALIKKRLPGTVDRKGKVPITVPITVRSLSEAIGMKVAELGFKLKDLTGVDVTINSPVDVEVAELIATEKGVEFEIVKSKDAERDVFDIHKGFQEDESKLEARAPVVTIMGHVDHGKTSLLDKIRQSNVVATETGGITQVIRAWRVMHNGKPITFLDTPGHEAFTKMRARGANVTDIVVIVVAANDGVMPQTEEAINHAKAANVSIVVAINKVDLPDANIRRTEQQLYGLGLIPDTMGGDCQFVHTSATKGAGISELLETLTLVAELKELKANPHKPAMGTCLEAHLSGDEGVMATLLVQQGTLHKGDVIICGATYGRVRAMYDDMGRVLSDAGPSVPVRVTGLDEVPNADDHFHVVAELSKAREIALIRKERAVDSHFKPRDTIKLENLGDSKLKIAELKVVLKAEARGSVEAIRKELEKLVHEEVRVRLLHAGIGAITESDVQLALASPEDTIVVGFNVVPDDQAMRLAEAHGISIREYNIIYKLAEDIKSALEGKLKPREDVIHLGRAIVREVFKISRVGTVAGCYVTQGTIERSAKVRLIRGGAVVYPPPERVASLESLKRFKEDVREVREGFDCGMKIAGYDDIKVDDVIEAYRIEQIQRTL